MDNLWLDNLVRLLAYCDEGDYSFTVMSNNNMAPYIFGMFFLAYDQNMDHNRPLGSLMKLLVFVVLHSNT